MVNLLQDLQYGFRILKNRPLFTAIAIVTIAIGIGANTAIFSVVSGVLLKPLPYAEPERLFVIDETSPQQESGSYGVSYPNYLEWKGQSQAFEQIAALCFNQAVLTGVGESRSLKTLLVSANTF